MEVDYWNEASERETSAPEAEYRVSGLDESAASMITDMVPLMMTLAVVGIMMRALSEMKFR